MIAQLRYREDYVCRLELDFGGRICRILEVENDKLLPLGIRDADTLNEWWRFNSIPVERESIRAGLRRYGVTEPLELKALGCGFSLANHYWICPIGYHFSWKENNLYSNDFDDTMGRILCDHAPLHENPTGYTNPDSGLNGQFRKRWTIKDGRRMLIKAGRGDNTEEPYHEVLASLLYHCVGIPAAKNRFIMEDGKAFSASECFTDETSELITAQEFLLARPALLERYNPRKTYENFIREFEHMGIENARRILDHMNCMDYFLGNTDRHFGNIGVLKTDSGYRMAPIYDNGSMRQIASVTEEETVYCFEMRNFAGGYIASEDVPGLAESFGGIEKKELTRQLFVYAGLLHRYSIYREENIVKYCVNLLHRYDHLMDLLDARGIPVEKGGKYTREETADFKEKLWEQIRKEWRKS